MRREPTEALDGKSGVRCVLGGVLMGLANLVPGISGGTMLLAAGIYPRFIDALADLSSLRFRRQAVLTLGLVGGAAALAILLGAGPVRDAVVGHRWLMYSLFIGLTLGGVPILWEMAKPPTGAFWFGGLIGLVFMVGLAWLQVAGAAGGAHREGAWIMLVAGIAGASAMILPGVSGGYLLLVLGVYVPVLSAIDHLKRALQTGELATATGPVIDVVLPLGVGVGVGILVISNLIKVVLERYEQATLGVLMGLLVGAVFGLWPFQRGVPPELGTMFKGSILTTDRLAELTPDKYPTVFYAPSASEIAVALVVIALGYLITALVSKIGGAR